MGALVFRLLDSAGNTLPPGNMLVRDIDLDDGQVERQVRKAIQPLLNRRFGGAGYDIVAIGEEQVRDAHVDCGRDIRDVVATYSEVRPRQD